MTFRHYTTLFLFILSSLFVTNLSAQQIESGGASYYADKYHGAKTAYGEAYDKNKMTCAHRTYPHGTLLKVSRMDNNKSVFVRVNDKGPYTNTRVVDLSKAAAIQLDMLNEGVVQVRVEKFNKKKLDRPTISQIVPKSPNFKPAKKEKVVVPKKTPQAYDLVSRGGQTANKEVMSTPKSSTPEVTPRLTPKSASTVVPIANPENINFIKPGDKGFGVQMASYSKYINAVNLIADLKEKGIIDAKLKVIRKSDNCRIFKVIVAPFVNRDAAVNFMNTQELNGLVVDLAN